MTLRKTGDDALITSCPCSRFTSTNNLQAQAIVEMPFVAVAGALALELTRRRPSSREQRRHRRRSGQPSRPPAQAGSSRSARWCTWFSSQAKGKGDSRASNLGWCRVHTRLLMLDNNQSAKEHQAANSGSEITMKTLSEAYHAVAVSD